MSMEANAGNPWPARAAYVAAAIFIGASGTINITYGWQKATDLLSSLTWAAVSAAVATVFALAWPVLIRSLDDRRWSAALIATAALILAGSYSITAALGSAAGSRYNAASTEQSATDTRKRAQAAYDSAQAEIARLEPSRSVAELMPLVEAAKPQCRVRVDSSGRHTVCVKPSGLLAELGRAHRRAELQDAADKASSVLNAAPGRAANTDTRALGRYLDAIGLQVSADRLNDLLTILAVVMIEAGGGLALALGLALSPRSANPPSMAKLAGLADLADQDTRRTVEWDRPDSPASGGRLVSVRPSTVAEWLASQGGRAQTSTRRLAVAIGRSRSAVHDDLHKLVAAGTITMSSGPRGTNLAMGGFRHDPRR